MTTKSQTLKVNREKLAACMTCTLCNKLFRDATTISECLHTFCRKCIYKKITEEDLNCCPVCNIDLGGIPLEKLRPDHNLQELRFKIFPSRRNNSPSPEDVSSSPLPERRKERSLSSLVAVTHKLPGKSSPSGRRLKSGPRKNATPQESTFSIEEHVKDVEDRQEILSSPETPLKIVQNKRQIHSSAETSFQHRPAKDRNENAQPLDQKSNFLNHLFDAASKIKSNKPNSQWLVAKPASLDANVNANADANTDFNANANANANEPQPLPRAYVKECGDASKVHVTENRGTPEPSRSVRPRKSQGRPKKAAVSERYNVPAQALIDLNSKPDERIVPIWFSLVASENQQGDAPLPQISSCYLRVKDGRLPVSYIKKYLVKKLNLASEAEVEISLQGRPLFSSLQLNYLVNWCVQTTSTSERLQASVGSSAKDFVMVLSYGRKSHPG